MDFQVNIDLAMARCPIRTPHNAYAYIAEHCALQFDLCPQAVQDALALSIENKTAHASMGTAIICLPSDSVNERRMCLATLETPVRLHDNHRNETDIVCVLFVPTSEGNTHLRALSRLSRLFRDDGLCDRLREAKDADALRAFMMDPDGWLMAA